MNRFLDKCRRNWYNKDGFKIIHQPLKKKKKLERYLNLTCWLKTSSFIDSIKIFRRDGFCHVFLPKSVQLFWRIRFMLTISALAGWTNVLLTEVLWLQNIKINICNLSSSTVIYLLPLGISSPAHFTFCLHYLLTTNVFVQQWFSICESSSITFAITLCIITFHAWFARINSFTA